MILIVTPRKYIYLSFTPGHVCHICLDYCRSCSTFSLVPFLPSFAHLHGPEKESFATRSLLPLFTTSTAPIFLRLKSSLLAPKIPVLWLSPLLYLSSRLCSSHMGVDLLADPPFWPSTMPGTLPPPASHLWSLWLWMPLLGTPWITPFMIQLNFRESGLEGLGDLLDAG